jgi:hypothetical protein
MPKHVPEDAGRPVQRVNQLADCKNWQSKPAQTREVIHKSRRLRSAGYLGNERVEMRLNARFPSPSEHRDDNDIRVRVRCQRAPRKSLQLTAPVTSITRGAGLVSDRRSARRARDPMIVSTWLQKFDCSVRLRRCSTRWHVPRDAARWPTYCSGVAPEGHPGSFRTAPAAVAATARAGVPGVRIRSTALPGDALARASLA